MRVRDTWFFYLVGLLIFAVASAQPASATLPTPNQPILVVQDSTSANAYQNFVPELLTTEGLNGFQVAQLGDLTSAFLGNYDVVILPHLTLTAGEATLFQNYVSAGGTLFGFRPDLQLANVFGVASLGTTLPEAWLKIDTTTTYASALVNNVLRFHGTADLYSLSGASALANLYNTSTLSTTSPAAAINSYGSGKAILFSFDLAQSIVLMRQGNPAWAGYPNNHDGFNTMRASQMFMDQNSGQFWNDLGDGALNDVPQADIQMRLFSNLVTLTNAAKRPLPKFWYYPNQNRSMLLMTGDDHSFPVSDALSEINKVASYGGLFSYNLWYPFTTVSNAQVNTWLAAGDTMAIHFNDTTESDSSGIGGSKATWNGMQSVMSTALSSFASTYPSAPFPVTTRNHYLIWVSNDANGTADQVAQAKLFQNNGIQFDTSYSAFPNRWGYMSGSGLPMKFLDPGAGTVIPVYEQATQYEDDVQILSGNYSVNWSIAAAQSHYQQSLSDSLNKYNTVITMLFHPENWSSDVNYVQSALQYAQTQSIPMSTTGNWLTFWKARAATGVTMPSFNSNILTFTATGSPAGLTLLVPEAAGPSKVVSAFQVDSAPQSFTVAAYQGVEYASVILTAGTHNVSVSYTTAGRILGQISQTAAAASTTIQVSGGSITQTVPVASNGTYVAGPLPAGNYTVTPTSSSYAFSPASQSVTMGTADVSGVNFNAASSGETLFTTQTPQITNASDGAGVNYELGTSFTSGVAGQITAVRFWKATSESGTHTGRIWSSTGTLLGSVTFANETSSGWQQQSLTTPLSIAASTTYVVTVNTGSTFYVDTTGGLSTQVVNGDLRSVVGNNGLYGSSGAFPKNTYQGSNYFRDVVFVPGATYSISGTIAPLANGPGTTVTLSGAASATATADANGNYIFAGLLSGSYTVTPTKSGFTFSPSSSLATVSTSNITSLNFTATAIPTYSISGTIGPLANGPGTTVTLSGAANASTTADSNGNYTFNGLLAGSYTVTPTKSGFTFSPANSPVTVSNANITGLNFTATAIPTYSISGTIGPLANGPGTTVTLSGAANATTTADSNGIYTFTGLANGSYMVTPTKSGFTISPANSPVTVSNANITGLNFTATAVPTYSISGTIGPLANGPGTTVTLSGAANSTATADSNGNYTFTGLLAGSYTVTPTKSGFTFSPANSPVTVSNANITGLNFTATAVPLTQSLFTTQTPVVTNSSDGAGVNYELGTAFTSSAAGQITAVRFWKASSETGTHTGRIWSSTGTLLASVPFTNETASGWQQQNLTSALTIAAGTTYVVSVNTGNTFYVATNGGLSSKIVNGNLSSIVGNNGLYGSTGTFPTSSWQGSNYFRDVVFVPGATYNISGTVSPSSGGSGTTLTLSGSANATTTADSSGNFTFTGLLNGSYTVTPSKSGYVFSPANAPATVNSASVTGVNFTATAVPTYTISGSITPSASGNGATVTLTLSGTTVATTAANTSGAYTFSGVTAGNYTVTPTKAGFTFSPTSAPANVTNSNLTLAAFAATSVGQTLFSTQTPTITNASDGSGVNYELGMSFTSNTAGQIVAIRFWKASSETGTHTGRIWSSTGTLLASVPFTNETASGWQQQNLTSALSIASGTTYVVSVNTGNTFYVATNSGLSTQIVNGSLSSVVGNNGLYGSTGTFPTNSWQGSNYFRDILFVAGP